MGRNGSGTFSRDNGTYVGTDVWDQDRTHGVKIVASRHDLHDQDIADEITNSIAADGQTTPSANLPMGGFRHTNVGAASARTDYARASQAQDGSVIYGGTSTGSLNAYAFNLTPAITAYAAGQRFIFLANHTCSGAGCTLAVNGLTAKAIKSPAALAALSSSAIQSGQVVDVVYDGTQFVMLNAYDIDAGTISGIVIDGNISYSGSRTLAANTADAADNGGIAICGGGASSTARGADLQLYGNESAFSAGGVTLQSGNVSGAAFDLTNGSSNGSIDFNLNGAERWQFQADGDLQGEVNNGGNIIFLRDERGLVETVGSAVASAGANQGAATALTKVVNKITTSGGVNTGVILSANIPVGGKQIVKNQSGDSTVRVYPHSGGAIDDGTTNVHINIATATGYIFYKVGTNDWQRFSIS